MAVDPDKFIITDQADEPDAEYQPWQETAIRENEDDSQFLFSGPPGYEPPEKKRSGWLKHILILFGAIYIGLVLGGPAIDKACVKGRLAEVQARAINAHDWNKCPKYMNGTCEAEMYDRVLSHTCSDLSRKILFREQVNAVRGWWRK